MSLDGHRRGLAAETAAAWFLRLKGYRILARRFKTPAGEIDIVARRGKTLVFAEVKFRPARDAALFSITPAGQRRIADAARLYLQRHPVYAGLEMRFDAVIVTPRALPLHLPHAWRT